MAANRDLPIEMSPDLLDAFASAMGMLFVLLDEEGRILRFNKACEQLSGSSFHEVQGRFIWDCLLIPEEVETAKAMVEDARSGRCPGKSESYWVTVSGCRRITWNYTVVPDAEGSPSCLAGIGMDFTDCHNSQQTLRQDCGRLAKQAAEQSNEFVKVQNALSGEIDRRERAEEVPQALAGTRQNIFDATQDAMFVLDTQWKILWCNQAMIQTWGGGSPAAVIGQPCYRVVHGRSEPSEGCVMARLRKSHCPETTCVSLNGRKFTVTVDPLLDQTGDLAGGVHVMVDVSRHASVRKGSSPAPAQSGGLTAQQAHVTVPVASANSRDRCGQNFRSSTARDTRVACARLVGDSSATWRVRRQIREAVEANCDTVLITGETGTGKEITALSIYARSNRPEAPFIAVSCGALPDSLVESELFGHVKGAFTGAIEDRMGFFELANGGTLFLDEIGDLSLAAQAKLLRVLETRTLRRVGLSDEISLNLRVIVASNVRLDQQVELGKFRRDLFYRLHVYPIHLLPLRDRRDEILPLANHFLSKYAESRGMRIEGFSEEAIDWLLRYDFPGNVRELRSMVERAAITCSSERILAAHFSASQPAYLETQGDTDENNDRESILCALEETHWNRRQAARNLGISYSTLRRRMHKLGLDK